MSFFSTLLRVVFLGVLLSFITIYPVKAVQEIDVDGTKNIREIFEEESDGIPYSPAQSSANVPDIYYRARVESVIATGTALFDGQAQPWQTLELRIISGKDKDTTTSVDNGKQYVLGKYEAYKVGDTVVLSRPASSSPAINEVRYIYDRYRLPQLIILVGIFFLSALYFGRKRGATSIIGLIVSILVIFYYIIPRIIAGHNPFVTCVSAAVFMCIGTLYLSHGFNRRTSIALAGSLLSLGLAACLTKIFVWFTALAGMGTEEAFYLQFDGLSIDVHGVLLGGIMLGVLGVLDDATTGQSAAVEEIFNADSSVSFVELYHRGLSVGREHIASLINTLVLAYVGASFPLLLLYAHQSMQPLWVMLNSNLIAEELVRTLVGSITLVVAVPLTNALAAYVYTRRQKHK